MTKEQKIQFIKRFLAGDAMNAFRLSGPILLKSILKNPAEISAGHFPICKPKQK